AAPEFQHRSSRKRDFEEIVADDDWAVEGRAHRLRPDLIGQALIISRDEMVEHEHLDAGGFGDTPDVFGKRVRRLEVVEHRGRVGISYGKRVEARTIGDFMDEDIGAFGKLRQRREVSRVAGEY